MSFGRIDLDGCGSPEQIAARIHELAPELPNGFDIEALCRQLDIVAITETETTAFEAALIMDELKAAGSILLATDRRPERRRYSIGHELGHFLIPTHMPCPGELHTCSTEDLHLLEPKEKDRRKRIEAEANRFAAALLMPPAKLRRAIIAREPNLEEIIKLAREFAVSKEAMARAYVNASRHPIAVVIVRNTRILRMYRRADGFPWIEAAIGQGIPEGSLARSEAPSPGKTTAIEECDPSVWLSERNAKRVETLTEQLLAQVNGYAMLLLHAELED